VKDQAIGNQVIVFDGLTLLIPAVFGDDALAAEEGPLKKTI